MNYILDHFVPFRIVDDPKPKPARRPRPDELDDLLPVVQETRHYMVPFLGNPANELEIPAMYTIPLPGVKNNIDPVTGEPQYFGIMKNDWQDMYNQNPHATVRKWKDQYDLYFKQYPEVLQRYADAGRKPGLKPGHGYFLDDPSLGQIPTKYTVPLGNRKKFGEYGPAETIFGIEKRAWEAMYRRNPEDTIEKWKNMYDEALKTHPRPSKRPRLRGNGKLRRKLKGRGDDDDDDDDFTPEEWQMIEEEIGPKEAKLSRLMSLRVKQAEKKLKMIRLMRLKGMVDLQQMEWLKKETEDLANQIRTHPELKSVFMPILRDYVKEMNRVAAFYKRKREEKKKK